MTSRILRVRAGRSGVDYTLSGEGKEHTVSISNLEIKYSNDLKLKVFYVLYKLHQSLDRVKDD